MDDLAPERDVWAPWRGRITASRRRRDDLVAEWQQNVDARKGTLGRTGDHYDRIDVRSDGGRVSINVDAPLTKAKIAQLYSQTPEVRLRPRDEAFAAAVPVFAKELNDTIEAVSVGTTIEEVLCDVVNASGIGAVLVSCDTRTETRDVPVVDPATLPPDQQMAALQGGLPTMPVEQTVDILYQVQRISPADLLVPSDFTGSHYDHARWVGHEGRMTWTQAQRTLGLTEDVKDKVVGGDKRIGTTHTLNTDTATKFTDTDVVQFTELFYWRHYYHADETSFKAIQRLVFVEGLDEPVIDEPYRAQQRGEMGLVGVTTFPIRVMTLTYISDDCLPPSDSTLVRWQANELEALRDAMAQQRKHSIPIRWGDTNRISANARAKIDKGDYQGFIWINGPGERAIGEVARASFPAERVEFEKTIKSDIAEIATIGTNQAGAFASGERSAREAGIIERNFQRRVGQDQDKVQRFFLGIAEVLAGHLALYGTFELPDELGEQRAVLANAFTYSVMVDATVRLDAEEQIERLTKGLNLTAQSGVVNIKVIVERIWELLGEDPSKVVIDPQPKTPEPVKVSVSKAEDLMNQMFVALLVRTGQAPTPEDMAAAAKLMAARLPALNMPPAEPDEGPPSEIERPKNAHDDWEAAGRIERRADDGGA